MAITYLSEIIKSLKMLDGSGSLKEICSIIEARNFLPAIHSNPNWRRNVSAVIQRHCRDTRSYQGAEDLFYSVYGLGEGFWGLRNYIIDDNAAAIIEDRISNEIQNDDYLTDTEREMLIRARRGQGLFRERILNKYHSCIITGISNPQLLVASHIRPWRSADNEQRLSVENGLLLSPLFDKLFDSGLISFSNDMQLLVSNEIGNDDAIIIGFDTEKTYIANPSIKFKQNMEYHRDVIFRK